MYRFVSEYNLCTSHFSYMNNVTGNVKTSCHYQVFKFRDKIIAQHF